mmetsp:Transcript_36490/g.105104  ORF Transcript_36490/g.105104 Transcript_36490/m.105104 type:complete len:100 (+) Transcript_36490:313-612(+)
MHAATLFFLSQKRGLPMKAKMPTPEEANVVIRGKLFQLHRLFKAAPRSVSPGAAMFGLGAERSVFSLAARSVPAAAAAIREQLRKPPRLPVAVPKRGIR